MQKSWFLLAVSAALVAVAQAQMPREIGGFSGFLRNDGQWDARACYRARAAGVDVWIERDGFTVEAVEVEAPCDESALVAIPGRPDRVRRAVVKYKLEGADATRARLTPVSATGSRTNFIFGDEPDRWVTDVPSFDRVRASGQRNGVDIVFQERAGSVSYDLEIAPEVACESVVLCVDGANALRVDASGRLIVATDLGELIQTAPIAFASSAGAAPRALPCRFRPVSPTRYGFQVSGRRTGERLTIDPGLSWSRYHGGSSTDQIGTRCLESNPAGEVCAAGFTFSTAFPVTAGAFDTTSNTTGLWYDGWASKFDASGALLWSTLFGGNGGTVVYGLGISPNGEILIAGQTAAVNFPTAGAFDTTYNGPVGASYGDGIVVRFNPLLAGGAQLSFSTYLGGAADDLAFCAVETASGDLWVSGQTASANFPTSSGAYQTAFAGFFDAFVTRLVLGVAPANALLADSSLYGGAGYDWATEVDIDAGGRAVISGTAGGFVPTTAGASQSVFGGGVSDGYVAALDFASAGAAQLAFATLFGGPGDDTVTCLIIETAGTYAVCGCYGAGLVTTAGAISSTFGGATYDGLLARIDATQVGALQIAAASYVGGPGNEIFRCMRTDPSGSFVIAGFTTSTNFPLTIGAFDVTPDASEDAILARVDPSFSRFDYATRLGGSSSDVGRACCFLPDGGAAIGMVTFSTGLPSPIAAPAQQNAYLASFDLLPAGTARFGNATPGCATPLIYVSSAPFIGRPDFAVLGSGAPGSGSGLIGLGYPAPVTPIFLASVDVFIDPSQLIVLDVVASDAQGRSISPMPIPNVLALAGLAVDAQLFWADSCAAGGVSASAGLHVVIQ